MITTVVMVLLNFVSWAGLEARDTPSRTHTLLGLIGRLWTVLRFPFITFFWNFIVTSNNPVITSAAVFLNCAFYAVIIERIFYLFRKTSKTPPVTRGI
jgi:hypothetical protein